jgi:hypothetical protein
MKSSMAAKKNGKTTRNTVATFPDIDHDKFHLLSLELLRDLLSDISARDELPDDRLRKLGSPTAFSVKTLCAAIHSKCTVDAIKWYLQSYQATDKVSDLLIKDGWPMLYYAAERNSGDLTMALLQYGVVANSPSTTFFLPLLAYVIIRGHIDAVDTSEVVKLLLAAGYDPTTIPMDMWFKYL